MIILPKSGEKPIMTDLAQELLEDVKAGDLVRVRYGTDRDQTTITGTILKWTDNFLTLQRADGETSKIRLDDSLRALETVNQSVNVPTPVSPAIMPVLSHTIESSVEKKWENVPPAGSYVFSSAEHLSALRSMARDMNNGLCKKEMQGILDSLASAVKSNDVPGKYHNLRARTINQSITQKDFRNEVISASTELKKRIETLREALRYVTSILTKNPLQPDDIRTLEPESWKECLTASDCKYLGRIYHILKRSQDYFSSRDFENRADCLRAVLLEITELQKTIRDEPTDVSYDIFLPALEEMLGRLSGMQESIYRDYPPKLTWDQTIQPFRTPNGQVQIQLTVRNEPNYQSADSLGVISIEGPEIRRFDPVAQIPTLRGGESEELSLTVAISDEAKRNGSFSADIHYSYRCNDSPQNVIQKTAKQEFTFIILNENFEPLVNPFQGYEGKPMDDPQLFIGRDTELRQIIEMVCSPDTGKMNYGRAIAMYGQTRTGKSSLLIHLRKQLEEKYGSDLLIWNVDNLGKFATQNPEEFLPNFLHSLLSVGRDAIEDNDVFCSLVEEAGLKPPLTEILTNPAFAVTFFHDYMKKLNKFLVQNNKIIVLLIDEFTYLHEGMKNDLRLRGFMRFWKALLQGYCVFAIIVGQDNMPVFIRDYPNEFACMELKKITYLGKADAIRLITEPLIRVNGNKKELFRDDGAKEELYELTAGSAYLTILLCSKLVSYLNEKGANTITKGLVHDFLRTKAFGPDSFLSEAYFEPQLKERGRDDLDDVNQQILLSIARLSKDTGFALNTKTYAPSNFIR